MAEKKLTSKQADQAAKALEALFASPYVDKKKLYIANFWRGIFFSIGTIIGATIVISLILWVLSFFQEVPLIGPVVENVTNTVQNAENQ